MELIKGNRFVDERGIIRFNNEFDMTAVKRMYLIEPTTNIIRAWQGHRIENKWFVVVSGRFEVKVVGMKNYSVKKSCILSDYNDEVIKIEAGFYNGFRALEPQSKLMVYSDKSLNESLKDDYRLSLEKLGW
jgi:dTDP-4-dehydrorhamnose 3,5-epimerase-like enzyme